MFRDDTDEYMLGCHSLRAPKHHDMNLLRPIASTDMESIRRALHQLGDFDACCSLWEICEANYQSVLSHQATLRPGVASNRHRMQEYMRETVQEMNRLLLNYLASFRTFVDHLETRYKRLEREGHPCLADFKKMTAACYDTSFPYRFFYRLRNYVQHCGMPISFMNTAEHPGPDGKATIDVSIGFDRDSLLGNYSEWSIVKTDLQKQPQHMNLVPLLGEFRSRMQLVNLVALGLETSLAHDSFGTLYNLVNEVQKQYPNGRPFIGRLVKAEGGQSELKEIGIPLHTMVRFQNTIKQIRDFTTKGEPGADSTP